MKTRRLALFILLSALAAGRSAAQETIAQETIAQEITGPEIAAQEVAAHESTAQAIAAQESDPELAAPASAVPEFTVEEAPEWTALFKRYDGWIGADGIFSLPLSGIDEAGKNDSTLLIFSDTMIGHIREDSLQEGWNMVNNTAAFLKGSEADRKQLDFYWNKDAGGRPEAFFTPATSSAEKGDYYWLGDGFVNTRKNNAIYLFAYRMRNLSDKAWSFSEMGNVLIKLPPGSQPPFSDQQQIETPLTFSAPENKGSFGAGILVNTTGAGALDPDGYVYVYGVRGKEKRLVVARVRPENFEEFSAWRYWDGNDWSPEMLQAADLVAHVSNELSVSPLPGGRYALVYQEAGISPVINLRVSEHPQGPFGPPVRLWECKEPEQGNVIVYNAKGHPALSKPGELLISYNVNAFDFLTEIKKDPNLYRPRFIRVKFKESEQE